MFIDNVLCTMLVHLGILDLSSCTVETLSRWNTSAKEFRSRVKDKTQEELDVIPKHVDGPRVTAQEAYTVRAAALDAGKVMLERVREIEGREGFGWLGTVDEADIGKFSTMTASLKYVLSGRLIIDFFCELTDGYLWAVAKDDPVLRKVPRMVERNTIMY